MSVLQWANATCLDLCDFQPYCVLAMGDGSRLVLSCLNIEVCLVKQWKLIGSDQAIEVVMTDATCWLSQSA